MPSAGPTPPPPPAPGGPRSAPRAGHRAPPASSALPTPSPAPARHRRPPPRAPPLLAPVQADIRRWPPGHPLSQQFPKPSPLPGAGRKRCLRGRRRGAGWVRQPREGGGGWGPAEVSLQEVTGGGGCGGRLGGTERVKTTLPSGRGGEETCAQSHVLEPARAGWLAEGGGGGGRCWERPQATFLGRRRAAGGHARPQARRGPSCLEKAAQGPSDGSSSGRASEGRPCLLRDGLAEMPWPNLVASSDRGGMGLGLKGPPSHTPTAPPPPPNTPKRISVQGWKNLRG